MARFDEIKLKQFPKNLFFRLPETLTVIARFDEIKSKQSPKNPQGFLG
ncbi:MAG: hypothetical protein IKI11_09965 [Neisseriaceae bacterium]|nr:hypothetical protein [Neisseriaceae bacterium]